MKIISTDDHLVEPPSVWADRLPARYRDRGPKVVVRAGGINEFGTVIEEESELWEWDGRFYSQTSLGAVAGRPVEEFNNDPFKYENIRIGCYDPVQRLKDMDQDGVWGSLLFPTFPRFAGTRFLEGNDREFSLLCVQAYNDFLLDEWCAVAPDRYIPMIILPLWDPQAAAAEVSRSVAKGALAVSFPENPVPLGLPSLHSGQWDPVFAEVQAADIPLCIHIGTSGVTNTTGPDAPFVVGLTLNTMNVMKATIDLLFSPIFYKFDNLKVMMAEGGIGWIPYWLEVADQRYRRHRSYAGIGDTLPSTLFRKHIWACFTEDENGVANRHTIGLDRILFETDYPHSDSLWPGSRTYAETLFKDVPDDEVHQIVELNARELFKLPTSA